MKMKKRIALLTSAVCCISMLSQTLPAFTASAEETAVEDGFEVCYDGWHGNSEHVALEAKDGAGVSGSRGMTVTGRSSGSDGACSSKGFYLRGGVKYAYSAEVCASADDTFRLTLTCADENGSESSVVLAEKALKAGEYGTISASYKAPAGSGEFRLGIVSDSAEDFTFDNVKVTSKVPANTVYAATAEGGLKDEFYNYFRVGNILNGGTVRNDAVKGVILKDFNSITCENETKPDATLAQWKCSKENIGVTLDSASAIFDFCAKNNISVRGHVLVWHSQTPLWFFKDNFKDDGKWVSKAVMEKRMESYIKNLFAEIKKQYPTLDLYAYDVVNEAVSDDWNRTANFGGAREGGYGDGKSPWVQVYGDNSFIERAFTYARKYAPEGCKLYYNDYNEYWDHKRDCIYKMCKKLYDKKLLDGVGMQSHINADMGGFTSAAAHAEAMKKYLSIGCDVQVTELDVSCEGGKFSQKQQAEKYAAIFKAAMDCNKDPKYKGKVTAICLWGPNDANTWISPENAPLLYDVNNRPKEAYKKLITLLPASEWKAGTVPPVFEEDTQSYKYKKIYRDTFESGKGGWTGRGSAVVSRSTEHYKGKRSLYVKKRTAAWNGATKALSSKTFVPGKEYSFSVNVMYKTGSAEDTFFMKLQYVDGSGVTRYASVAEGKAKKGKWTKLENQHYFIPYDAKDMQIYVETASSTISFYIDEAKAGYYVAA